MGCCDENGECLAGTALQACGAGGATCAACEANQACHAGACGLIDGGDYDASFPDRPDSSIHYDAGVFDAGPGTDGGADAGRPDGGTTDAGSPMDAGGADAGGTTDAGGMMDAGMSTDAGVDAGAPVSFASEVQPIFDGHCGTCHSWSYTSTVSVASGSSGACSGRTLIVPNDLGASLLYGKVSGTPPCGAAMPLNGTPLDSTQLDVLARWILQGALDN